LKPFVSSPESAHPVAASLLVTTLAHVLGREAARHGGDLGLPLQRDNVEIIIDKFHKLNIFSKEVKGDVFSKQ